MHLFNVLIYMYTVFFLLGVNLALTTHVLDMGTGKGREGGWYSKRPLYTEGHVILTFSI